MKPETRWNLYDGDMLVWTLADKEEAKYRSARDGLSVVEYTILPTADLERLVRAAEQSKKLFMQLSEPASHEFTTASNATVYANCVLTFAALRLALAPFTGDADAN